ncbi:MAG: carboxypeptidase regulatory-like domain-containing protein [Acidobacteriia bacterium]|nr:carboxypeptidase regulatory-like domain-containing protein [Terriglobia bacterium]
MSLVSTWVLVAFWPTILAAAVIRGNVVENQTGKPLARAVVTLQPLQGTPSQTQALRTDSYGAFTFSSLGAGAYVARVSKTGFLPTEYGQKHWNSAGTPIALTADSSAVVTIRLSRYGAITGRVVDENDVGLGRHRVAAYRDSQPPLLVTGAISDDRGVYRLSGLEPGTYLVRTAAAQNEGLDYLPTFSKETLRVEEAQMVAVALDEESPSVDVRPAPGKLFTLSGVVEAGLPGAVTITLAGEMGRQTMEGSGPEVPFEFRALAPGPYELYAEMPGDARRNVLPRGAYTPIILSRDTNLRLPILPIRETQFEFSPPLADPRAAQLWARRVDPAGPSAAAVLPLTESRAMLFPGRWEIHLLPPPGLYVSGFSSLGSETNSHPEAWNEITIGPFGLVKFSLSGGGGSIHGIVRTLGDALAGAPVHLEAYDPVSRRRVMDLQTTRTDLRGAYRFDGLAPGIYRVLATFEYQAPDTAVMDQAGAQQIQVQGRSDLQLDLDLYMLP